MTNNHHVFFHILAFDSGADLWIMEVSTVARKSLFDWSPLFNGLKEGGEDAPPPPPAIVTAVTEFSREPRVVKLGGPLPIDNEHPR